MDILELVKRRQIMTTTENKPKRKRGRPKKVETDIGKETRWKKGEKVKRHPTKVYHNGSLAG